MDPDQNNRVADRLSKVALILSVIVAMVMMASSAFAAPTFPKLDGRVTDAAGLLPPATRASLDARLAALEKTTSIQIVVATVPDLQGYEIDEYGYQLGRTWGIGQKGTNNGAIILVAPNERKVRIEVGYGLEGTLTDALTSQIIRRDIIPRFKAGDMAGGVVAGTDAVARLLELPADQRAAAALQASQAQQASQGQQGGSIGLSAIVWIIIIVFWLAIAMRRGKRGRGLGSSIIWGPGLGGWGGGGGGGGFGGGGFGGGGGSFGGGGSSGSW